MKQQFRIKLIAAAVAVMASASAQAVTVSTSTSGSASFSELALVAFDISKVGTLLGTTYVRGLGVQMDAFLPNSPLVTNPAVTVNTSGTPSAAAVFAGGTRTPSAGATFSNAPVGGDTNWSVFTATVGNLENIRWGVVGRKAGTASTANSYPAAVYTGAAAPTNNAQVQTLSSAFNTLMDTANAQGCSAAADSCVTEIDIGSNLGAAISFNGVGVLADLLPFTLAFKNTNLGPTGIPNGSTSAPALVPFCNSFDCAKWSINSTTGAVTYTLLAEQTTQPPVSQVPVPAAGWLLLTGIAGLVGFSRRKRNAA
ncbi:MAG: VPLPA-CTERM sorting domain-containing protein [Pseudomonadota bacterium]